MKHCRVVISWCISKVFTHFIVLHLFQNAYLIILLPIIFSKILRGLFGTAFVTNEKKYYMCDSGHVKIIDFDLNKKIKYATRREKKYLFFRFKEYIHKKKKLFPINGRLGFYNFTILYQLHSIAASLNQKMCTASLDYIHLKI